MRRRLLQHQIILLLMFLTPVSSVHSPYSCVRDVLFCVCLIICHQFNLSVRQARFMLWGGTPTCGVLAGQTHCLNSLFVEAGVEFSLRGMCLYFVNFIPKYLNSAFKTKTKMKNTGPCTQQDSLLLRLILRLFTPSVV